ncbi:MAG TPA: peptidoglycan-binding domain-containing protein, partial [Acidimicrobiales bacterium]
VMEFQQRRGLQVDGTVGNQTWAALQGETPVDPSTDGRTPHTYVERGPEARFQGPPVALFWGSQDDELHLTASVTGDQPLSVEAYPVTVRFTAADGATHVMEAHLSQAANPGDLVMYNTSGAKALLGSGTFRVEAYMATELGGDAVTGEITIE